MWVRYYFIFPSDVGRSITYNGFHAFGWTGYVYTFHVKSVVDVADYLKGKRKKIWSVDLGFILITV